MQTMMANARSYDWPTWFIGIMRALFSGGGGALTGAIGPMLTDRGDFNFSTSAGLKHTLVSMAAGFLVMGFAQVGMFLKTHGAPDQLQADLAKAAEANLTAGGAISDAQKDSQQSSKLETFTGTLADGSEVDS